MNKNIISLLILLLSLHAMAEAETDSIGVARNSIFDPPQEEQVFFYHKDHLGSTLCITDRNGQIVERSEYIPYGEVFVDNIASDAEYETPYKFTGKEYDEETGLYYFGARYLHPKYATWLSVDPLATKYPNVSPYVYCHGNPISWIDPNGMDDYYNEQGVYLGSNNKETDFIFITNNYRTLDNGKIGIYARVGFEESNLSAKAYSNIFTDILNRVCGVDKAKLVDGRIGVAVDHGDYWSKTFSDTAREVVAFSRLDKSSTTGKQIAVRAILYNGDFNLGNGSKHSSNKFLYSTISNVVSILFDHEYNGHGQSSSNPTTKEHYYIYTNQFKSDNYKKTTKDFKYFMENHSEWVDLQKKIN